MEEQARKAGSGEGSTPGREGDGAPVMASLQVEQAPSVAESQSSKALLVRKPRCHTAARPSHQLPLPTRPRPRRPPLARPPLACLLLPHLPACADVREGPGGRGRLHKQQQHP